MVTPVDDVFAGWAIVEVVGRKQYAGLVREQLVAGAPLLRVDVPEVPGHDGSPIPAFTKFVGPGSIYMLTPTDEVTARRVAQSLREVPVRLWQQPTYPPALQRATDDDAMDDNPDSDEDIPDDVNEICGIAGGSLDDGSLRECQLEPGHEGEHASPEPDLSRVHTWPRQEGEQ